MSTWTEHGVLLQDGTVAAAASEDIVRDYIWGRPVSRHVRVTAIPRCGEAVVEVGDWQILRARRKAS